MALKPSLHPSSSDLRTDPAVCWERAARKATVQAALSESRAGERALAGRPTVREVWTRPLPVRGDTRPREQTSLLLGAWDACRQWARRVSCGLSGHEMLLRASEGRVWLECLCGRRSPGWTIGPSRPIPSSGASPTRRVYKPNIEDDAIGGLS